MPPSVSFVSRSSLSERVDHFVFQADFQHEAGQYVAFSASIGGETVSRYYSLASAARPDRRLEFCIQRDGIFGNYLVDLQPGVAVRCSEPAGKMRLLDASRETVYLAAGTGIAPLRAMLQVQLGVNPRARATLVLGARQAGELLFRREFAALAAQHEGFRFLPTVSREDPAWTGLRGRPPDHLDAALAGRTDVDAYFCGQREMVAALRERLAQSGIPDGRQVYERY